MGWVDVIDNLRLILDLRDNSKDELLYFYIEMAKRDIEIYTKRKYCDDFECVLIDMVVEKYNRRFNEGVLSSSANSISTSYASSYSDIVTSRLNKISKRVFIL